MLYFILNENRCLNLDELLECAVDGRADRLALVEVNGGNGALADAFRGEIEFLDTTRLARI